MQFAPQITDDFKTNRKDIAPPLQASLRIIPVVFYLGVALTIALNAMFAFQFTRYSQIKDERERETREIQRQVRDVQGQFRSLQAEAKRATDIASWVAGNRPLQPLIVSINRSMLPDSFLTDLRLIRDSDNPTQIRLSLKMSSEEQGQLDLTLAAISQLQFRSYSPQQTVARGEVDYQATLIWQETSDRL